MMHQPVETPAYYVYMARRRQNEYRIVVTEHNHAPLLGPYRTRGEADDNVDRARELAKREDAYAHFHEFGTLCDPYHHPIETKYGN